jgi:hypothetical protein
MLDADQCCLLLPRMQFSISEVHLGMGERSFAHWCSLLEATARGKVILSNMIYDVRHGRLSVSLVKKVFSVIESQWRTGTRDPIFSLKRALQELDDRHQDCVCEGL